MAAELQSEIITEGSGTVAETGNRVSVHYEGKLTNGEVFTHRGHVVSFSFTIGVGQVIRGWEEGVAGMKAGEVRRLTTHRAWLWRGWRRQWIPPNATPALRSNWMSAPPVTLLRPLRKILKCQGRRCGDHRYRLEQEWWKPERWKALKPLPPFRQWQRTPRIFDKFRAVAPPGYAHGAALPYRQPHNQFWQRPD